MAALRRCATPAGEELLLGALGRLVAQPPLSPVPLPALPPVQPGDVFEFESASFVACSPAHATLSNPKAASASRHAYDTGTFAVVYGGDVALGDDLRGIQRVFFAALGQRDAEELAGYGPHPLHRRYALPAFARHVKAARGVVKEGARRAGYVLQTQQRQWRRCWGMTFSTPPATGRGSGRCPSRARCRLGRQWAETTRCALCRCAQTPAPACRWTAGQPLALAPAAAP